jgi:hypothetical protein
LVGNGAVAGGLIRGDVMMIGHKIVDIEFDSEMTTPPPTTTLNFITVTNAKIFLSFFFLPIVIPID